jgi:hypothetical protein
LFAFLVVALGGVGNLEARYAVPPIEHAHAVLWLDLSDDQRQRLSLGALDALRNEGATPARALAAQMLARIQLVEPGRLQGLPRGAPPPRAEDLAALIADTRPGSDARAIAQAAYATFWLSAPERFPWRPLAPDEAAAIAPDIAAALDEIAEVDPRRAKRLRELGRAQIAAHDDFSYKMIGVELLEAAGLEQADLDPLVDVLISRSPEHSEIDRLADLILSLRMTPEAGARVSRWLAGVTASMDRTYAPLFRLSAAVGVRQADLTFIAGMVDSRSAETRAAATAALSTVDLDPLQRDRLRQEATALLATADWKAQAQAIRTLEWLGPTDADLRRLGAFLWRQPNAYNVAAAWDVAGDSLDDAERAAIADWARRTLLDADFKFWGVDQAVAWDWRRAAHAAGRLGLVEGAVARRLAELLFVPSLGVPELGMDVLKGHLDVGLRAAIRERARTELSEERRGWPAAAVLEWLGTTPGDVSLLFENQFHRDDSGYGRSTIDRVLADLLPGSQAHTAYLHLLRGALGSKEQKRRQAAVKGLLAHGPTREDMDVILQAVLEPRAPAWFPLVIQIARTAPAIGPEGRDIIWRALRSLDTSVQRRAMSLAAVYGVAQDAMPAVFTAIENADASLSESAKAALIARASPGPVLPTTRVLIEDELADLLAQRRRNSQAPREAHWINGAIISFIAREARATSRTGGPGDFTSLVLRAAGLSERAFDELLDGAASRHVHTTVRLALRLHAPPAQRHLLAFLGEPGVPPPWGQYDARALAGDFHAVAEAASLLGLDELRSAALARMAEAVAQPASWTLADVADLRRYAEAAPMLVRAAIDGRIDGLESRAQRQERIEQAAVWAAGAVGAHALLWLSLAFAYPRFRLVQAVFFWNPRVRRLVGLGYAVPLILAVPALRRRMVRPFESTLLADADLPSFQPEAYFAGQRVKPLADRRSDAPVVPLAQAIPDVRGHVVLEGASGLGKTLALRALARTARRPVVFLPARRVAQAGTPVEAIARKMQGPAREVDFIRTLLHVNALDLIIDGLNEVGAETRLRIVEFVEDLPRANVLLATQPIAWTPPQAGATRRFELLPLADGQIIEFLLSREALLPDRRVAGTAYRAACHAFIARTLGPEVETATRTRNRTTLSNPMDLTLAAELIAGGATPDPGQLVEQQLAELATWFEATYGRAFPKAQLEAHAFEQRLADDNRIALADEVVDALLRFRLGVPAPMTAATRGTVPGVEARFRHDRIAEVLIARHLLDPANREAFDRVLGDPRFAGAVIEVAARAPAAEACALFERVSRQAEESGDPLHALAVAQRVAARL